MRRATRLLPAAVAAGCLAAFAAAPAGAATQYFDVGRLPVPPVTGKEIADEVARYSKAYKNRVSGSPQAAAAAQDLVDQSKALGYEAGIVDLAPQPGMPPGGTHAVVASRRGTTKPDEHILFIAHYDIVPQTIEGAYDDGSGTMMLLALAKALRHVPTNRTIDFVWYNTEEQGLIASQAHARDWKAAGKQVRAALGFDMVGIAWPVAAKGSTSCLCVWRGDDDEPFEALLKHVNYSVLGFPGGRNEVEVGGLNPRNSDESSWDIEGYPSLRWAGMRRAADYRAYHAPDDTIETIDTVAGGRMFFEQGLRNTLLSSYYTTLALDNEMPVVTPTATGTRPVTFDASDATDPDGPVSDVVWDFGDGTSARGARVTHEYAKSGVYTATVSVGDSLWPQVRRTATVTVQAEGSPAAATPPPPAAQPQPAATPKKATKKKRRCRTVKRTVRNKKGKAVRKNGKRVKKNVRVCSKKKKKSRRSAKRRSGGKRGR